jgi:hypothetical protein
MSYVEFMETMNPRQAREEIIRTLKNSSKETISIRLSPECLTALKRELLEIKRNDREVKNLTVSKYISVLVEQHAESLRRNK